MRLFVTGGTGFIGSHFIKHALAAGHDVVALKRNGSSPCIPLSPSPTWIEGDLCSLDETLLRGFDALIHLAAVGVSPQPTNWKEAFDVNVTASIAVVSAALIAQVPRIIACGSCFEYGRSGLRFQQIPPDAPLEPIGPYAASKAAFAVAFASLARTSSASFTLLRPFHLYGEGQNDSNFWPSLQKVARSGENFEMTAGEQIRDYAPVSLAAESFLAALNHSHQNGECFISNIGSGNEVTLHEFANYWWNKWEAKGKLITGSIPYRESEVMRFVPLITS